MDFALTEAQQEIREAIQPRAGFGDEYWLERDRDGECPARLPPCRCSTRRAGIAMPEAYGGSGLGITEAAVMMQAVAK